ELRLCHRRPRRRGRRRAGGIRGAPVARPGPAPRLPDVAPARAAGRRSLTLRAAQHVEIDDADAHLPADGMAERADQQRRAAMLVGIGCTPDVPPEPAVRPVAENLAQHRAGLRGTELDPAELVAGITTIPGRADREVIDAVAIQIAGGNDHPSVQLARLGPGPVP